MTDKELAEEYANKEVPIDTFGYRSLDDVRYDVRQAFLAGLEAGRDMAETDLATITYMQGAESGYNKAFVEADKNLKAIVTDFNKAKELIKEMLSILPKENIEGVYEITEEAEQFLRKSE